MFIFVSCSSYTSERQAFLSLEKAALWLQEMAEAVADRSFNPSKEVIHMELAGSSIYKHELFSKSVTKKLAVALYNHEGFARAGSQRYVFSARDCWIKKEDCTHETCKPHTLGVCRYCGTSVMNPEHL